MNKEMYDKGMATHRKVMGDAHIAKRRQSPDIPTPGSSSLAPNSRGEIWSRPGMQLKVRSLVTLAMITSLRPDELKRHIRGALNNGATKEEIMEVFHHASGYCGMPAANGSVRIGVEVFRELGLPDEKPVNG